MKPEDVQKAAELLTEKTSIEEQLKQLNTLSVLRWLPEQENEKLRFSFLESSILDRDSSSKSLTIRMRLADVIEVVERYLRENRKDLLAIGVDLPPDPLEDQIAQQYPGLVQALNPPSPDTSRHAHDCQCEMCGAHGTPLVDDDIPF